VQQWLRLYLVAWVERAFGLMGKMVLVIRVFVSGASLLPIVGA
jgi:hypothetical protein